MQSQSARDAVVGRRNTTGFFAKELDRHEIYWIGRAVDAINQRDSVDILGPFEDSSLSGKERHDIFEKRDFTP